jgi:hypothetical protein
METVSDRAAANFLGELLPRTIPPKANIELRVRRGLSNVPQFGLGLASEGCGFVGWRVYLKRKLLPSIEDFDKQWETSPTPFGLPQEVRAAGLDQPMKVFAGQRAIGHYADITRPVAHFP